MNSGEERRAEESRGERRGKERGSTLGWIQRHYTVKACVHMLIFSSHSSISRVMQRLRISYLI